MAKTSAVSHFVAVSDLSKPATEQEGILVEVSATGGDSKKNRAKALDIVQEMWEKEEIDVNRFPDGLTQDHIFYVPSDSPKVKSNKAVSDSQELLPIVQGAQEIIQLTKLQLEVQDASEQAEQYVPIIKVVLERSRPLTSEEKELAKDKKYGKTIEKLGSVVAAQEEFQETCTGNGSLVLNAIAWQLDKGIDSQVDRN
ncbi:hypothetical protein I4641_08285 [Waterburya agarophytonicola K14]|uniref:Uncharacterized protein n=1 Tax=Waterburya agarophytonicola KI4 TaxID=2874699 RepID=A0A964BQI8_9CYAN|nr:hypothetical protein [Waterburya agarophytonicola]MCC0176976.1 hypothetical protein [Waterburya agarophytonicola KI4]